MAHQKGGENALRSPTDETSTQKKTRQPKQHRFSAWLDEQQVKRTVRRWHRQQKHQARKGRVSALLKKVPHAGFIGDALYMVGFWTEYAGICAGRGILKVAVAVLSHVGSLLFTIFRPIGIGLVVFLEDLLQPFVRLYSGHPSHPGAAGTLPGGEPAGDPRREDGILQERHPAVSAAGVECIHLCAAGGRAGCAGCGGADAAQRDLPSGGARQRGDGGLCGQRAGV